MENVYRPCPVCRSGLKKRETPENFKSELPSWFAYECFNCGTYMLLQPFRNIKQVAKG